MPSGDRSNRIRIALDDQRCLHARSVWASCRLCYESCPSGALAPGEDGRLPSIDASMCLSCGQCMSACPLGTFSSPDFSERQLMARIHPAGPISLRCFLPYGELEQLAVRSDAYHLSTCLAALSPGVLFELAHDRPCELVTSRCESCVLFPRVKRTMASNVQLARSLLADSGREQNLVSQVERNVLGTPKEVSGVETGAHSWPAATPRLALGQGQGAQGPDVPPGSAQASAGPPFVRTAAPQEPPGSAQASARPTAVRPSELTVRMNLRAIFHGRDGGDGEEAPQPAVRLRQKQQHVPFWRERLRNVWDASEHTLGAATWPIQQVDADACKVCGMCKALCPTGSIAQTFTDGVFAYAHTPGTCVNCNLCVTACPAGAISRAFAPLSQPFDAQTCFAEPAHRCPRCRVPALDRRGEELCLLCLAEPDRAAFAASVRAQLGPRPEARSSKE